MSPRPAQTVMVFSTSLPERPYVEVGVLQARQSSGFSLDEMPDIIAEMRAEAGRLGCDGLVVNGASDTSSTAMTASRHDLSTSSTTLEGFWGTCIAFTDTVATAAR